MGYYCDVCVKTIKINSKSKHPQNLTHNELEKCIPTNHTIENLDFFHIDEIFNYFITNHNKNLDLYLVICDFKLVSDNEFYLYIKPEIQRNPTKSRLKIFFLLWIEYFFI